MLLLPDHSGSDCHSSTSIDPANTTTDPWGEDYYQELIDQANTVPLTKILKKYGIQCFERDFKIRCPFKFHQGGRENTASFKYYQHTNSFWCFGCKTGGRSSHFVAAMEKVSVSDAADKILRLFSSDVGEIDEDLLQADPDERLRILMDFSNTVREFRQTYPEALEYAERAGQKLDQLNLKRPNQDNDALEVIVEQLKSYLEAFK